MKRVAFLAIFLLLASIYPLQAADDFIVVIDAGHGGKDPGATRGKTKEKDINLTVALNLGKLIEQNFSDVKVVYTRKNDVAVELERRAAIANRAKGNLFISIHTNSTTAESTTAAGADTYILGLARSEENIAVQQRENSVILLEDDYKQRYQGFDPNSPESHIIFEFMTNKFMEQSLDLANLLQKNFKTVARRTDRGVRQAGFLVLRETAMPSVLIELGFINNRNEARYLSSAIGQRSLASAIFAGFKQYKKEFDKKQGSKNIENSKGEDKSPYVSKPPQPLEQQPSTDKPKPQQTSPVIKQPTETNPVYVSKPKQEPVVATRKQVPAPTVSQPSKPVNTTTSISPVVKPDEIEYRIQILASGSKLAPNSSHLKGVSPVNFYIQDGMYKYTYGSVGNRGEATRLLYQMKLKFKDAFIVEFRNGKRIK